MCLFVCFVAMDAFIKEERLSKLGCLTCCVELKAGLSEEILNLLSLSLSLSLRAEL